MKRFCYSQRTHYLLNDWTLRITDPEIRHQYDLVRYKRFSSLLKPAFVLSVFSQIIYMLQDFTSEEDETMKNSFWAIPEWTSLIIWYTLNRFSKKLAPIVAYLYPLMWLLMINLSFRDKLNEKYFNKDV
jgi:hypothetical protein